MVTRAVARITLYAVIVYTLVGALGSALWWALDSGPLAADPRLVLNDRATSPAIRVYGDHRGLDPDHAARLTTDALVGAGGFDRSVLLVTIPTGSGWVDPAQVTAIEDWSGGDVATVAMRYSSAPSAAVYALRPELAADSAHAILVEITSRLRALPRDDRPRLVVHGLSLGAQAGAEALRDPGVAGLVDAALWQGRPGAATVATASAAPSATAAPATADPAGSEPLARCTVIEVNSDDPVAELGRDLLRDPVRALRVLSALPGSDSAAPGIGHRYRPILPPSGCVSAGL